LMGPPAPAPPPGDSAADVVTTPAALLVKDAFAEPASVLHDVAQDVYLVSNVNGSPSAADDNGFISRVSPEGKVLALKWIDGAQDAVELNAPQGMAIVADVLYVADLDQIRKFDLHSGTPLGAVVVPGATFLSDVAAAPDGTIYFADMGARAAGEGGLERTGTDAVYKLVGDQPRALLRGKQLDQPKGLYADAKKLWVVTFGSDELYDALQRKKAKPLHLPAGKLDGIIQARDGRLFISSGEHDQIFAAEPGQAFSVVFEQTSHADIGYDAQRNCLLIPLPLDNALKLQPL
jgi:sugar lactone lactonase YvrE